MTSDSQSESGGVVSSTALLGRVLEPHEEVMQGDKILLIGNSWITAQKTEHVWHAKDYIEVRRPNIMIQPLNITIVTPCSRPVNLFRIASSIPSSCRWLIALDTFTRVAVELPRFATVVRTNATGGFGGPVRNFVLDSFLFPPDEWIYFLDDDNIIHPHWESSVYHHWRHFGHTDEFQHAGMMTWGQCLPNGASRLPVTSRPAVGNIDMASFMVRASAIAGTRFADDYQSDGRFAAEISARTRVYPINHNLCYYNYLR